MTLDLQDDRQSATTSQEEGAPESRLALPSIEICVICLDLITDRATALPCHHDHFDFSCIGTWLQESQVCPLCKSTVRGVQYNTQHGRCQTFHIPDDCSTLPKRSARRPRTRQSPTHHRHTNHERHKAPTDPALNFRPTIYAQNLPSLHIGSSSRSRYHSITPSLITTYPDLQRRARTWIRRELSLFPVLHRSPRDSRFPRDRRATNTEYLLDYIVAILKAIDLKGSQGQAVELVGEFLGRRDARLFLHELEAWLKSPYEKLGDWDQVVQYKFTDGRVVNGLGESLNDVR